MVADPQNLLVALRHPLRRDILKVMVEHGDEAMSPRDLSRILAQPLSNVSYHVRTLVENEALELEDTEPVRGSLRHLYRPTPIVQNTGWVRETLGLNSAGGDER